MKFFSFIPIYFCVNVCIQRYTQIDKEKQALKGFIGICIDNNLQYVLLFYNYLIFKLYKWKILRKRVEVFAVP